MLKDAKVELLLALQTLIIDLEMQAELADIDLERGAEDQAFLDKIEKVRWIFIPRFMNAAEELINDIEDPFRGRD